MAAYQELLDHYARRYNGWHSAEYDDLFQEGALAVIEAIRAGRLPSKDVIVKRMTRWVSKCARQGVGGHEELDELHAC